MMLLEINRVRFRKAAGDDSSRGGARDDMENVLRFTRPEQRLNDHRGNDPANPAAIDRQNPDAIRHDAVPLQRPDFPTSVILELVCSLRLSPRSAHKTARRG